MGIRYVNVGSRQVNSVSTLYIMCKNVSSVMSSSLRLHGLWIARLLCPWHFPGTNTGVGCHLLLQRWLRVQTGISCVSCIGRQILFHWSHSGNPHTMKSKVMLKSGKKKKKKGKETPVQVGYSLKGNQFQKKLLRSWKSLLLGGSLGLGLCCIILLSFIRSYRSKYQFKSWILHVRSIYFGI